MSEFDGESRGAAATLALLDEIDVEADNIRAALRYCLADPTAAELGLRMAVGLGSYWKNRAVTEGDPETRTMATEYWTFVRSQGGHFGPR